MAQLKRYNGVSWENVGGSIAPKTTTTTSDTDTYSCNYINNLIKIDTVTIDLGAFNGYAEKYNQTYTLTNIPSGYTFSGIVGYNLQGNYFTKVFLSQLHKTSDTTIEWGATNLTSTVTGALTLYANVLYIKTS